MKYALTKNPNIAEHASKTVKIFQHDQCNGVLNPVEGGEVAQQYQCENCYKSGYLVKKLPPPRV